MRPTRGLRAVPGDVAEIWQGSRKVGVVFRWLLSGFDGAWKASGTRARFEPDFDGQVVQVRFLITSKSGSAVRFVGEGHVLDPQCDGEVHSGDVSMVGTRLRLETADIEGGSSNG